MSVLRVLVVDDDPKIRTLMRHCLEGEGYAISEAETAQEALDVVTTSQVDLVTLDINLGDDDGFDLARAIRKKSHVPIIMLTGKNDVIDRVVGLEIGADDYITKPFHVREVIARVKAILRRAGNLQSPKLECGCAPPCTCGTVSRADDMAGKVYEFDGLTLAPDLMDLRRRDGSEGELTSADFKLLQIFLERPKRVLSRETLMDLIGGIEWSPLDRTVDNQVARLRKKIERDPSNPKLIKTVRGIGYTLACDVTKAKYQEPARSA